MRFTLVIFAVLLVVGGITQVRTAYAQPNSKINCDDDCVERKLPYLFCDKTTGEIYTKCSQNPNGEPNLKPLKKRLPPSCRTYDASGLTAVQAGYSLVEWRDGVAHTLFDPVNVEADALAAAYSWYFESGCPEQTDGQDCCLNIRWARDKLQLKHFENNPEDVLAIVYQKTIPSTGEIVSCNLDCNESAFIINSTPEFTNKNNNGIPTRFFYNVEPPTDNGDDYEYFHLPSVALHEIGHWYGLGHMGEPDHFGEVCGETRQLSVMGTGLYAGEERNLSRHEDDLCAFRKLYCCAETATSVSEEKEIQHGAFTVYPNPSYSHQLSISTDQTLLIHSKKVQLVNAQGRTVLEAVIPAGETLLSLRTDSLPTGVYLVRVSVDALKGSISKKVIIR